MFLKQLRKCNCTTQSHKQIPISWYLRKQGCKGIKKQYNDWFSNDVSVQLTKGVDLVDFKVTSKLSNLKALHASWIVYLYKHLPNKLGIIVNGSDSAGISEAVTKVSTILDKVENPSARCRSECRVYFRHLFIFILYIMF